MLKRILNAIAAPFRQKPYNFESIQLPESGLVVFKVKADGLSSRQLQEFVAALKPVVQARRAAGRFKGKVLIIPTREGFSVDIAHWSDDELATAGLARIGEA